MIVIATTGPVTQTGIVAEANFAALRVPANVVGKNGLAEIRMLWSHTNSVNNKTLLVRWTTAPGVITGNIVSFTLTVTANATTQGVFLVENNNTATGQYMANTQMTAPYFISAQTINTMFVDTTVDSYININGGVAAAGETLTLQHAAVVIFPGT